MPLFDFDGEWDWSEFGHSLIGQFPILGKWYARGRGQWFPYWNMTEEQFVASYLITKGINSVFLGPIYYPIMAWDKWSTFKHMRSLVRASPPVLAAAVLAAPAVASYHGFEDAMQELEQTPGREHEAPPMWLGWAQALTGTGPGVGSWTPGY